jgi:hypothetical protein
MSVGVIILDTGTKIDSSEDDEHNNQERRARAGILLQMLLQVAAYCIVHLVGYYDAQFFP